MAFQLNWLPTASKSFHDLESAAKQALESRQSQSKTKSSKQEGLFKQVAKALRLLENDPRHPGLNCHIFSSLQHPWDPSEKVWEAYAQNNTPGAYRIFWCYGPGAGKLTIIDITSHP